MRRCWGVSVVQLPASSEGAVSDRKIRIGRHRHDCCPAGCAQNDDAATDDRPHSEPAIAWRAGPTITTTPASRNGILKVPVGCRTDQAPHYPKLSPPTRSALRRLSSGTSCSDGPLNKSPNMHLIAWPNESVDADSYRLSVVSSRPALAQARDREHERSPDGRARSHCGCPTSLPTHPGIKAVPLRFRPGRACNRRRRPSRTGGRRSRYHSPGRSGTPSSRRS